MKKIIAVLLSFILVFSFAGCAEKADSSSDEPATQVQTDNPIATITVKNYGTITVELYDDIAPNTVRNFIALANSGFYDGLIFHRVIENFMIQGGDPEGTGMGGPDYAIKGEFTVNGFENNLSHRRGVISMARAGYSYDSAGSQCLTRSQQLTPTAATSLSRTLSLSQSLLTLTVRFMMSLKQCLVNIIDGN